MIKTGFISDFSVELLIYLEDVNIETVSDLLAIEEPKWCGVVSDINGEHYSSYEAAAEDDVDEYNSSEVYTIQNGELVSSFLWGEEAEGINDLMVGFKELVETIPGIKDVNIRNLYEEEDPVLAIEIEIKRLVCGKLSQELTEKQEPETKKSLKI